MTAMEPAESTGQESDGTAGALTRTELNVLRTMIAIIVCFIVCWAPVSVAIIVDTIRVRKPNFTYTRKQNLIFNYLFFCFFLSIIVELYRVS